MDINNRFKDVRKTLKLSGELFGRKLGITKHAVSYIENGKGSVTDRHIKDICREFNVNEDWLRNGIGDMFNPVSPNEELAQMLGQLFKDEKYNELKKILVKLLLTIPEDRLQEIEELCVNYSDSIKKRGY